MPEEPICYDDNPYKTKRKDISSPQDDYSHCPLAEHTLHLKENMNPFPSGTDRFISLEILRTAPGRKLSYEKYRGCRGRNSPLREAIKQGYVIAERG